MRNLKKILAMALALVMSLSLVTIANAADFSDDADISYKEAVDVMSAIGVINGYEDGSFQPDGILTREEAAKLICTMLLGENADRLGTSSSSFTDVAATRWSAPSIEYCVQTGIIAGNGDGTFDPEGELTGYAFAKMLLVALGYDSTVEGYTGAGWTINVAADATTAGIDVDGVLMSNQVTREVAAQMALNTLEATMVRYSSKGTNITLPDGTTVNTGASDPIAIDQGSYSSYTSDSDDDTLEFCERYFSDLTLEDGEEDAFGRPGSLWTYNKEDIGTYGKDADYVVVLDDDYTTGSTSDKIQEILDDNDLKVASTDNYYLNGEPVKSTDVGAALNYGAVLEVFVDDDDSDDITDVIVYNYTLYQIEEVDTDVSSSDERDGVSAYVYIEGVRFNDTDIPGFDADTYEEDAYVAAVMNAAGDKILESYIPEVVTGSVTTKNASSGFVTVDGDRYYVVTDTYENGEFDLAVADVSTSSDDTYALYLDKNGNVIGIEGVESAADINDVYYVDSVWEEENLVAGAEVTQYFAQIVGLDGTVSEIELETKGHDFTNYGANNPDLSTYSGTFTSLVGKLYTTSDRRDNANDCSANDDKYNLTAWYDSTDTTRDWDLYRGSNWAGVDFTGNFSRSATRISDGTRTYRLNSSTQYIFLEDTQNNLDVAVYTGGVSYTWNSSDDSAFVITENDSLTARYIIIRTDDASQSAEYSEDVIFINSLSSETGDGYISQTVYLPDGTSETWDIADGEIASGDLPGFFTYDTDEDGYYVLEDADLMSVSGDMIWDGEEGVISGTMTSSDDLYETLLTITVNGDEVEDIETDGAVFVDVRSDSTKDAADEYSNTISSLSRLANLFDRTNNKVISATLHMNVSEDGAVCIFLTSAKIS